MADVGESGQAGAEIEVTPAMLRAGVRELLFWLDGADVVIGETLSEQIAASVFSTMAAAHQPTVPNKWHLGNSR